MDEKEAQEASRTNTEKEQEIFLLLLEGVRAKMVTLLYRVAYSALQNN